jgi:hypothetical protein
MLLNGEKRPKVKLKRKLPDQIHDAHEYPTNEKDGELYTVRRARESMGKTR